MNDIRMEYWMARGWDAFENDLQFGLVTANELRTDDLPLEAFEAYWLIGWHSAVEAAALNDIAGGTVEMQILRYPLTITAGLDNYKNTGAYHKVKGTTR